MKRWSVIIGIVIVVAAAATVFAVQQYSPSANNVAIQAQESDGEYSSCGGQGCDYSGNSATGSGCGGVADSGGCGSTPLTTAESRVRAERMRSFIYAYYAKKFNDPNLVVQINDYGCHMEADVLQNGKIVKRLSISGNSVSEIG